MGLLTFSKKNAGMRKFLKQNLWLNSPLVLDMVLYSRLLQKKLNVKNKTIHFQYRKPVKNVTSCLYETRHFTAFEISLYHKSQHLLYVKWGFQISSDKIAGLVTINAINNYLDIVVRTSRFIYYTNVSLKSIDN